MNGGPGFIPPVAEDIARLQEQVNTRPIGERIAFWGERFIGAPYDVDPLGEYVRTKKAVCDERVDCMYLVFRAVELAQANTPEGAADRALDLRFRTRGRISCGSIANYEERFEYGEDMAASGRWGRDITAELGSATDIPGSRGRESVTILPKDEILKPETHGKLKTGDLIFFVKAPERRVVGEVVGHLGIIKAGDAGLSLIHASGSKASAEKPGGGIVKEVSLLDYVSAMKFIGAIFTRFE
ncbi:MAG: hypothetical protein HZA22_08650 [Nitrospirae bacterium]|nr:hypothetical protein [Nitrospirota bacterium]